MTNTDTRQTTSEGMLEMLVLGPYTVSSTVPKDTLELRNLVAQTAISKINEMEKALVTIATGTPDREPPYRAMEAPQMRDVASKALSKARSFSK